MRRIARIVAVLASATCLSVGLVACGGDDDEPVGGSTPAAAATSDAPTAASADSDSEALSVTAQDFSFTADKSTVQKDAEVAVAFENQGSAPHTINFYTDEAYTSPIPGAESGRVNGGASAEFTFSAPDDGDTAYYRCEVHPTQMEGTLTLE